MPLLSRVGQEIVPEVSAKAGRGRLGRDVERGQGGVGRESRV